MGERRGAHRQSQCEAESRSSRQVRPGETRRLGDLRPIRPPQEEGAKRPPRAVAAGAAAAGAPPRGARLPPRSPPCYPPPRAPGRPGRRSSAACAGTAEQGPSSAPSAKTHGGLMASPIPLGTEDAAPGCGFVPPWWHAASRFPDATVVSPRRATADRLVSEAPPDPGAGNLSRRSGSPRGRGGRSPPPRSAPRRGRRGPRPAGGGAASAPGRGRGTLQEGGPIPIGQLAREAGARSRPCAGTRRWACC